MFKSLLSTIGIGGASVDTILDSNQAVVGGVLTGRVEIKGGSTDQALKGVVVELVTSCIVETRGDQKTYADVVVTSGRIDLDGIKAGEHQSIDLGIDIPLETPLSVGSTKTRVRTRLDIANAVDAGDNDLVHVHPNAVMSAIFEGIEQAGFHLVEAEVEHNPRRAFPLVQEFDFRPYSISDYGVEEVEISFRPSRHGVEVSLTVDRRGGFFTAGGERSVKFQVSEADLPRLDMGRELRAAINRLR